MTRFLGAVALCAFFAVPARAQPAPGQSPQCNSSRLVGTWERVSLLRNALSVQPPDAPLFVKFGSDGYWSMMEMPERPKVNKPLQQQTAKELWSRFERVEGGQGTWTIKGDIVTRKHLVNIAPGGENNAQDRACMFEGEILALIGTGANRSPQARFKRLAAQPLKSSALAGTWERTSLAADGTEMQVTPQIIIFGDDGWFSATELPAGRKRIEKPLDQYTVEDYVNAFGRVGAVRGTYAVDGNRLTLKHVDDINPNRVGFEVTTEFSVEGGVLTVRGISPTGPSGSKVEAKYRKLPPLKTEGS